MIQRSYLGDTIVSRRRGRRPAATVLVAVLSGLLLALSVDVAFAKPVTKPVFRESSTPLDKDYFKLPPLESSSVLGLAGRMNKSDSAEQPGARVAYGSNAAPGAWPYVGLTLINVGGSIAQCASTKIAPRVALTAAHCLQSTNGISEIGAAYGITNQAEYYSRKINAYEYSTPDNYDNNYFSNDIGLIAFANEIQGVPSVQLSPYPNSQLAGVQLYVAGWGLTETQYLNGQTTVSDVLKYAPVPYISQPDCKNAYSSIGLVGPPTTHFCAGGVKADACMGDSGGPLSIEAAAYPTPGFSTNIQVGVVSHGPVPCGGPNNIGAYTDVNQYLRWINDEIWYNNWEGTSIPAVKNVVVSPKCYSGAVISTSALPSGGDCCKACKENANCGSWDYTGDRCVQHAMGGFSVGGGTCASGWLDRQSVPSGVQTQPGFLEYPGASMKIDTLAVSPGGCGVACQNQAGCKYFTYIGPIGGSNKYNDQGANCQLASADASPTPSTRFANAVSGTADGSSPSPTPVPSPPEPTPSPPSPVPNPPSPMPSPTPSPGPSPDYLTCKFRSGTYVLRNAGTSCSGKYAGTDETNCRSKSVKMKRSTSTSASKFVLENTSSGSRLTAVKYCRTKNNRLSVSSKDSRKVIASLSRYSTTWRFLSWNGEDCSVVGIQAIARASRGYSSFLSRSGSCSRNTVFVSTSAKASTSAWELVYVSSSTMTTRKKC